MSRSALWRQEGARKQREQEAEKLFQLAVEEGRYNRAKNILAIWGPDDTFHFNPVLLEKCIKSQYFQKCCRDITDWNTLVDEIYYQVQHLEPWSLGANQEPSTAFCLLLRLLTLRCTEKQMKLLLDHPDSPYIRGVGFLYLRFVGDPKTVYEWIEPYLYDEEPITITANAQKKNNSQINQQRHRGSGQQKQQEPETIGDFVRRLFSSSDRNYYGTMLPRLPIHIERDIQVKLLLAEKTQNRAKKHLANKKTMDYFQKLGSQVMALYGDDENPTQWYEAVIDRVITRNEETSLPLKIPKFVVTFPEYGNTETVSLGEMELKGVPLDPVGVAPRDKYEEIRRREREKVTTSSNHAIARRPIGAKSSLAAPLQRKNMEDREVRRSPHPPPPAHALGPSGRGQKLSEPVTTAAVEPKKRSAEEIATIQEKKRKLMAKYG